MAQLFYYVNLTNVLHSIVWNLLKIEASFLGRILKKKHDNYGGFNEESI